MRDKPRKGGSKCFMFMCCVLRNVGERFYLGSTIDLKQRLQSHNRGENKATKGHQWELVYYEAYLTLAAARQREHKLKQYGLASRVTALPHPAYQRRRLRRTFRDLKGPARPYLGRGFPLRCFQRLSRPYIATRQCHWRDNRNTRGTSTPVLSY